MSDLDEKDMKILSLLAENARQPFSEIGEEVDLSGPAVSTRVTRLQEIGIINRFTIDIDRSKLRGGAEVLIDLDVSTNALDAARAQLADASAVEHVFVTAEANLRFYARIETRDIRNWISNLFDDNTIEAYTITIVDDAVWTPAIDGMEFAMDCVECGQSINNGGETARIGGEIYYFCCPSCLTRFEDRYQRLETEA